MRLVGLALRLGLFIILLISTACESSKFIIWKDKTYQGHPVKILAINSFPDPATRGIFEEKFLEALKKRGVDSVMRYAVINDPIISDKDAIAAQAKEVSADTVLITRPVGTRPGIAGTLDMSINTQTDVYDMKTGRLIIIATAETQIPEGKPSPNQIKTFIEDLVNQLSRVGLFY
jgi:hypothetical protein